MATEVNGVTTPKNGDMTKNEKTTITRVCRDLKAETATKISVARIRTMVKNTPELCKPILEMGAGRVWRDKTWEESVLAAVRALPDTIGRKKMSPEEREAKVKAVQKGILEDVGYYGSSLTEWSLHHLRIGFLAGMKGDARSAGHKKFDKAVEKSEST